MANTKILNHTKKHIVAYLDILGAQKLMLSEESNTFLNILQEQYEELLSLPKVLKHIPQFEDVKIKIFSDNIIIVSELVEDKSINKTKLERILQLVSHLQVNLLVKTKLLRGGITIGELFINDTLVYGAGLIEAYNIESTVAIYPRIVVSSEVAYLNEEESIIKDFDGNWFVNFYWSFIESAGLYIDMSSYIDKVVQETNLKDYKIRQKINWLINYHNLRCDEMKYHDQGYLFTDSKLNLID